MKNVLKAFKGQAIIFGILAPLVMFGEVIMDMQQPRILELIIDEAIYKNNGNLVIMLSIEMIIFALIGLLCGGMSSLFAAKSSLLMAKELRTKTFDKVQKMSFREIDRFKTSSLITRLTNDITQIQNMVQMALKLLIRSPFTCIFGIIFAYLVCKELSIIFIIAIPIVFIFILVILFSTFPLFSKLQKKIDGINLVMRENLLGIRVIKAFTMEKKERKRFEEANYELMDIGIRSSNRIMLMNPFVSLFINIAIVIVLWYGGKLSIESSIKVGQIASFLTYMRMAMLSVLSMIMIATNISRAKASIDRVNEVLLTDSSIIESKKPVKTNGYRISFRNVSFSYNNLGEYVLKSINLDIKEGEHVGIIGPTGSGKSSLIQLIPRLYDAQEGNILVGGVNVRDMSAEDLRDKIGIVLQENILFSGTIEDNLLFGNKGKTRDELIEAAKNANAYDFIMATTEGFETNLEQRARNLSGGQKQRLSIARTILRKPEILIMDDSTSALDLETEASLQKNIKSLFSKATTILIAQRITAVMDMDKIVVLENGCISAIGKHKDLIKSSDLYRSIAASQLGEEALK